MDKFYTQKQIEKAFYRGAESAINSNNSLDTDYSIFIKSEIAIDDLPHFDKIKKEKHNNYLSKYDYIHLQVFIGLIAAGKDRSFADSCANDYILKLKYE